ncbi:unnamed protein product [Angiostrongylus costaricensis]|uniref:CCR4-NOT transcription complex subunit 11 n=1 Tax=Angiostrongylus costaricensis TaxID=334426 RepID=A0A158PFI0_ANGCS|nr:unnamed protein product [Angiostrongylus costaricensis]
MANGEDQQQPGASAVPFSCAFLTATKYQEMKDHFRLAVQKRENCVFSGSDAVNIMEKYLQADREHLSSSAIKRENALKVLETWLRENVIRPTSSSVRASPPLFSDSENAMYTMNPERDHNPIVPWFQIARICAPTLYFQSSGKPDIKEIHKWAKLSLDAVSERYALITHHGSSPLIPKEYSVVLDAIVKQLLGKNQQKSKLALQYLCLMIPQQMRDHLSNVVQFLEKTTGTDQFVSLRGLHYLGIMGDNDNFRIALNELRCSIFPQTIETSEQNEIIEFLIEFRKEGTFGRPPEEMQTDLRASRGNATKEMMLSVRFCAAESSPENFDAEVEIASTLAAIIDDFQISPAEKQKKCELFKQQHPRIYRKYFAHLSW